jgi:hypothetical protein
LKILLWQWKDEEDKFESEKTSTDSFIVEEIVTEIIHDVDETQEVGLVA